MNPSNSIIPCVVEENPKTTLKIYSISKQSLWFIIASTSNSFYYYLQIKKTPTKTPIFVFHIFLVFQNSLPLVPSQVTSL
jgi:hypothetical protein